MTCTYLTRAACALILSSVLTTPASAQWNDGRADSHAPIGVMADHRHEEGEMMLSYRYMRMHMEGMRDGTNTIADTEVVNVSTYGFMVTPTKMPMNMHMFGMMYAPSHTVTLMGMLPIVDNSMDHITRAGGMFTTESGGLGDVKLGAMIGLSDFGNQSVHLNAMFSLPTGSIEQMDVLPTSMGNEVQLPYPMQVGSGTFDAMPSLTWLGQSGDWSWGAQGGGTIRFGSNDRDWTLGSKGFLTAWWGRLLSRNFSAALRLEGTTVGDIDGVDAAGSVNPMVVPTARTDLRNGERIDAGLSFNLYFPQASALRFAGELLMPVYQTLDGPQLETDWTFVFGIQVVPIR